MALSYDEADALADFAAAHGITYPLLSDPDSDVIRRFGILNTLIDPDDHPWYGIPFPGSYVIDADGIITAKFFEHSLANRASGELLLRAARGEDITVEAAPADAPAEVRVEVAYDTSPLAPCIVRQIDARFTVPAGQHLYGPPVADGMVEARIVLDADPALWHVTDVVPPPTSDHHIEGTGETVAVYDGDLTRSVRINHNGQARGRHRIDGHVEWQACDDQQCFVPRRQPFTVELELGRIVRPQTDPDREIGERFGHHFARMTSRRS